LVAGGVHAYDTTQYLHAHPRQLPARLSANEVEDTDDVDPFMSAGPTFFDTTAVSVKESIASSSSPGTSTRITETDTKPESIEDGRGSPDPIQSYFKPVVRGQSRRISRANEEDKEEEVGGRRLFVVNASPDESEEE
jgi:hypothetical protein